jgi:energy-coupling factor transport system ATP-binding protein
MIELRDLTFSHDARPDEPGSEPRTVLDRVDLTVEEGELLLVSGPTGSGKSTLLGVVAGLVPRFSGGHLRGDVLLDGVSIVHAPPRERAASIGFVGQDPAAGFVTDTVEEELAYGMEQLGLPAETMRRRVEETLDLLGIAELRSRDLRTLSGGQQQRVAIGAVLTMHPRLLVLDEPTSALDPTAAEDVLAILTRLVHDLGVSVLLAEHRLERVVPFADRMVLLGGDGRVRVGEPADLLADSPVVPPLVDLGRALGWSPLPLTVREARRKARSLPLEPLGTPPLVPRQGRSSIGSAATGLGAPGLGAPGLGAPGLSATGVTVSRGRRTVLRDVSLELAAGRVTALMGRNGAGKSTLLWTLQGSRARLAGTVDVAGHDPAGLGADQRRHHVGLLPQTAADLLYLETVEEECEAGGPGTRALLDRLVPGIPGDRHPRDLSEGQRLALALALVLAADPPVLLLDEPTRGLDYAAKHALAQILHEQAAGGRAVLIATHDVEFVAQVADEVVVLADGEVVSAGDVRRVVAESPAFAPQVTKVLGAPWLRVDEVVAALAAQELR